MYLNGFGGHFHGSIGSVLFRHGTCNSIGLMIVFQPGCFQAEVSCIFDLHGHFGQFESNRLMIGNHGSESLAFFGIGNRSFHGTGSKS